jgi:ribosomal protein L16 Arg81 hydroxylase
VEYSSGKVQPNQKIEETPKIDLGIAETIENIENCDAWMVIKNVETVPEYRAFLEECLSEVADESGADMADFQGFIFVSSANTVTPFHVDAEENILLQIKGQKFMHVFDNEDRALVSDQDMEISPSNHRNRDYRPEFEKRAKVFELNPGDGVHVPYLWPHWVRTGDEYCISIAITWKTPQVLRNNKLLAANALFRKVGLPQSGPGAHPLWDHAKVAAYGLARALVEPLRKSEHMRKWLRGALFGRKANYYYES